MTMFVEQKEAPLSPAAKKMRNEWVQIGAKYLAAKKKDPKLTVKAFSEMHGLKYETVRRNFSRFKERIKEFYDSQNPNKTKADWVKIALAYLRAKEDGVSAKEFAEDNNLNYSTMSRAFRKYKSDIEVAKKLQDAAATGEKLSNNLKLAQIKADFHAQVKARSGMPVPKSEKKSDEWFKATIKAGVRGHKVDKPKIGRLYTFIYDAKHKNTLPYWDVYPLIIYLGRSRKHKHLMLGLNLHYIPPKARVEFLEQLLKYATTTRITNKTALDIDWTKVKNVRGSKLMIKAYIPDNIKATFVEVKPADWVNVVFMKTSRFVHGPDNKSFNTSTVWSKYK